MVRASISVTAILALLLGAIGCVSTRTSAHGAGGHGDAQPVAPKAGNAAPRPFRVGAMAPRAGHAEPLSSVKPVEGKSWIATLGRTVAGTRMGKMGGTEGARTDIPQREKLGGVFLLTGGDIYRLECQSCHGVDGKGSAPEIASIVGPVQGSSSELLAEEMKKRGRHIPPKMLAQLSEQAMDTLRKRIRIGGKTMPSFEDLDPREIDALVAYLQLMVSGRPSGKMPISLPEPPDRVGWHVVHGTCHICHDATGPGGHPMVVEGGIPSLESLPHAYSLSEVLGKVRDGRPAMGMHRGGGMMGGHGMMGGGHMGGMRMTPKGGWKMPVLPFLTDQEVTAAYHYLEHYPPRP